MKNNASKPASSKESINATSQRTRRVLDDAFKTKVVLATLRDDKTLAELSSEFDVHPNQISQWRAFFLQNATSVFSGPKEERKEIERLEQERDELHKVISRNAYYYEPKFSDFKLKVMARIDELYTKDPTSGQRKLQANLKKYYGIDVGRRLIRHLMEIMQIAAIYPKPYLSIPDAMNRKFPYLLRNVPITHVNQVWSTDITYIRLKNGFAYLTAVIDWYSRRILSWRLSTTLSTDFCEEAVREAIQKYGWPEVFNTDQGSQYTSKQFTDIFTWEGCPTKLPMDSKGRAYDNIFVERFWKTLKQEDVYIRGYETVMECRQGLKVFMTRYNDVRLHSSLDWNTPSDVYFKRVRLDNVA